MAVPYCDANSLAFLREHRSTINFLLDSGAFTAWKQGREFSLDEYCAFVERLPFRPFGYFTLDKIGDPRGTRENFAEIRRRGHSPIPIFTRGSDWSELDEWFAQSDIVGVGGGTGTKGFPLFIRDVSRRVAGTGRKVHWLGFTDRDFIRRWQPFSCDSSSVNNATKYHNLITYQGGGRFQFIHHSRFREDPVNSIALARGWAEWCGEDLYALRKEEGWKQGAEADRISTKAWAAYAIDCELRFGTRLFFALVNVAQLQVIQDCWGFCRDRMVPTKK